MGEMNMPVSVEMERAEKRDEEAALEYETPWRVYRIIGDTPEFLAGCDDVSLADTLLDLRKQRKITDTTVVGIMYRPEKPGEWIVHPFARGMARTTGTRPRR